MFIFHNYLPISFHDFIIYKSLENISDIVTQTNYNKKER